MKAVVLNGITPADQVKLTEVPIPQVKPGWVLVKVRAFGMNHSEQVLRLKKGGIVCNTGILGGVFTLNDFDPIKDIPNGVYLTGFFSNYPAQHVMDAIFSFLKEHRLMPRYGRQYAFHELPIACEALDSGNVNGKIVITV